MMQVRRTLFPRQLDEIELHDLRVRRPARHHPFLLRANLTAQLHLHVAPSGVSPKEKSPYDGASFVSCVATSAAAIVLPALPGHGDPRISFSVVTLPFAKQTFW